MLLHAGTNDMIGNKHITSAPARLGNLIDKIIANNLGMTILVAQIIRNANEKFNALI